MSPIPAIKKAAAEATELRRQLHRIPELQYQEHQTASFIRQRLDELKIPYLAGVNEAPTATIATIGNLAKPCIALRADIDALPIEEQTGAAWASTHRHVMHACGHDGHTAALLGAAEVLKQLENELDVCVKLIFQPAEEGGGGGRVLVQQGVLDGRLGPKVEAIFGLHGWPILPIGMVSTRAGALLAAMDQIRITIRGQGGHAAFPHLTHDPVVASAMAILGLQSIVSRQTDPTDSLVISIAQIQAGTAHNVIPDECTFSGTVRTVDRDLRRSVPAMIRQRMEGIAAAHGCQATLDWIDGYPIVMNDPAMSDLVARVAGQSLGEGQFIPAARPSMGGEDFAFYLEKIPGCFFMVGLCPPSETAPALLHTNRFDFNDQALPACIGMHVGLVLGYKR
ncbi:MAG: amidohydrolase [Phycisphaerales bacterium]|nr:amidohydrolase [Phycisphaerales bacterium]